MRRKQFVITVYLTAVVILFLAACNPWRLKTIPDAEIVFAYGGFEKPQVGFINGNGENFSAVDVGKLIRRPKWSIDGGGSLYGIEGRYQSTFFSWGQEIGWKSCKNWMAIFYHQNVIRNQQSLVLLANSNRIWFGDSVNCKDQEVIVDLSNKAPYPTIVGMSYYDAEELLLYATEVGELFSETKYQIMKIDLKTGEVIDLLQGINPAWSPDGKWIAFVSNDGIYIADSQGTSITQLVAHPSVNHRDRFDIFIAPQPVWSPDGQWVIYHRCQKTSDCRVEEQSVYKVNIETGQEEFLIEGASFPHWKP